MSRARSVAAVCLERSRQGRDLARGAVLRDRARELRVLRVDGVCRPRVLDEAGFPDVAGFAADAAARGMDLTAIPPFDNISHCRYQREHGARIDDTLSQGNADPCRTRSEGCGGATWSDA